MFFFHRAPTMFFFWAGAARKKVRGGGHILGKFGTTLLLFIFSIRGLLRRLPRTDWLTELPTFNIFWGVFFQCKDPSVYAAGKKTEFENIFFFQDFFFASSMSKSMMYKTFLYNKTLNSIEFSRKTVYYCQLIWCPQIVNWSDIPKLSTDLMSPNYQLIWCQVTTVRGRGQGPEGVSYRLPPVSENKRDKGFILLLLYWSIIHEIGGGIPFLPLGSKGDVGGGRHGPDLNKPYYIPFSSRKRWNLLRKSDFSILSWLRIELMTSQLTRVLSKGVI